MQVYEGLTALSEAVGPQFVMAELHKRAAANKNPKVGWGGSGAGRMSCHPVLRCLPAPHCIACCVAASMSSPILTSPPRLQVLAEALGWMAEVIPEFGLAVMDVKAIIEWCKADLGSANAPGEQWLVGWQGSEGLGAMGQCCAA